MARRREPPDLDPTPRGDETGRRPGPSSAERSGERSGERPGERPAARPEGPPATDAVDLPETYGKDEVELLCKDPHWCFIYWEVTETGLAAAREQLGPSGDEARLLLRVFITTAQPGGRELRELRDVTLEALFGRRYLEAPRSGSLVRAAVGVLSAEGLFAPIAHSSLVRVPPGQPASETSAEWLSVQPPRGDGRQRERIIAARPEPVHRERGVSFGVRGRHTGAAGPADASDSENLWFDAPGGVSSSSAAARPSGDSDGGPPRGGGT